VRKVSGSAGLLTITLVLCSCASRESSNEGARLAALADSLGGRRPYHACGMDSLEEGCLSQVSNGEVAVFTGPGDRVLQVRRSWAFSDSSRWAAVRDSLVGKVTATGAKATPCSPSAPALAAVNMAKCWYDGSTTVILSGRRSADQYILHFQVGTSGKQA